MRANPYLFAAYAVTGLSQSGSTITIRANPYLFAAYAVTWIIHLAYISTIVARYARLKREIAELKKAGGV